MYRNNFPHQILSFQLTVLLLLSLLGYICTYVNSQRTFPSNYRPSSSLIPDNYSPKKYAHKDHPDLERRTRQLNSLTSTNLQAAGTTDYGYNTADLDFGGYASAGGHGSSYGHGGGGHGHGKKDCNSALGLLGVLGLVSFLQNVLRQMTTTAATGTGRKKRDATEIDNLPASAGAPEKDVDQITLKIMPFLVRIGQALDKTIPFQCSLHAVCTTNEILTTELGAQGQSLGLMISESVIKMFTRNFHHDKLVEIASAAANGRIKNQKNYCDKQYKACVDENLPSTDILKGFMKF